MSIIKIQKRDPGYALIDNRVLNDPRLSWKAKGVLCYLLSKPPDWKVQVADLANHSPGGEYAVRAALDELLELGYAERHTERTEAGTYESWNYIIHEEPLRGFPQVDNPDVGNRALTNTESTKKESTKKDKRSARTPARKEPPPSSFRDYDAERLLKELTGWLRVPGNDGQQKELIGAVLDIHDQHNSSTIEYLRPFWDEYRRRYPNGTHTFWLLEWAATNNIPPANGQKPKQNSRPQLAHAHTGADFAGIGSDEYDPGDEPAPAPTDLTWTRALAQLHMPRKEYYDYVDPCRVVTAGAEYVIAAPDAAARDWLAGRLTSTLARILTGVRGADTTVKFITEG